MNSLAKARIALKEGVDYELKKRVKDALDKYASAVKHFQKVLESNDPDVAVEKRQVKIEMDFYIQRMKKLEIRHGSVEENLNVEKKWLNADGTNSDLSLPQEQEERQQLIQSEEKNMDGHLDMQSLMITKADVKFADVCGLDFLKTYLLQTVGPFNVRRSNRFLLYGPPGTGKTLIVKALAGEKQEIKFFSISVENILSKYVGESVTFLTSLFENARRLKPSIVLLDDIDVLVKHRTSEGRNTRRFILTNLLIELEEMKGSNEDVFIIATTHAPNLLNSEILSRFDKLFYLPLPTAQERLRMFKQRFSSHVYPEFSEENFKQLAAETDKFSWSEISNVCIDANNLAMARITNSIHFIGTQKDDGKCTYLPCDVDSDSQANEFVNFDVMQLSLGSLPTKPHILFEDLLMTIANIKPTIQSPDIRSYEEFVEERVIASSETASITETCYNCCGASLLRPLLGCLMGCLFCCSFILNKLKFK